MSIAVLFAASLALAFLTESLVEYIFGTVFDHAPTLEPWAWLLMYVSLAVGVGLAFWYRLDLIAAILSDQVSTIGIILTGLIIGRGANYLHDFVTRYLLQPHE